MPDQETYPYVDRDDRLWHVPFGVTIGNPGPCRGCGQLMLWVTLPSGKRTPLNATGITHFATCPKAGDFRRRDNEPPPFEGIETIGPDR